MLARDALRLDPDDRIEVRDSYYVWHSVRFISIRWDYDRWHGDLAYVTVEFPEGHQDEYFCEKVRHAWQWPAEKWSLYA